MTVAAEPQQSKGFLEWCRDAAAPAEVRYTVTVLIVYLETDDCAPAARSLAPRVSVLRFMITGEASRVARRPSG